MSVKFRQFRPGTQCGGSHTGTGYADARRHWPCGFGGYRAVEVAQIVFSSKNCGSLQAVAAPLFRVCCSAVHASLCDLDYRKRESPKLACGRDRCVRGTARAEVIQPLLDLCKSQLAEGNGSKHGRVRTPYGLRIRKSRKRPRSSRSRMRASSLSSSMGLSQRLIRKGVVHSFATRQ